MPGSSDRDLNWSHLLRSDSSDRALREIGRWLGSGDDRVTLTPEDLLDVWRLARKEIARAEAGLAKRSRELDLLQSLGRRAAEAGWAEELFDATASVLHEGQSLDLVLIGYVVDGRRRLTAFLARPFPAEYLTVLARRAARFLGWSGEPVEVEQRELELFDAARGSRGEFCEEDLVLLPVLRQGQPVACLLVIPSGVPDEERIRVLYSASNQLSLHLDRILTVREAEADRFRSIVDSMPQGVVLVDARLQLLHSNRPAREMLAAAGLSISTDLAPLIETLELSSLVERVRAGLAPLAEGEVRPDDERVWTVTVSPVTESGAGNEQGFVLVLTNVSERRRLQQELAQSEKMSSLGRMISGVAHELNNPLASILGYAQLVAAGTTDEKLAGRLQILRREADRCRKIVENLLSFARHREPEIRMLSLNDVVRNVVSLLDYQLRVDDVRVVIELDPELPALRGDPHQLEQVLVNLLTNAQHAIRKQARPGVVRIRSSRSGNERVVLEVTDDGPGIPAAIRSRIFDPFFTTKPVGEGTGLGLSLVYGIVDAHGGEIEVQAAPSGGSIFRLTFRRGEMRLKTSPSAATPDPLDSRHGRILVVDDERPVARLICEALAEDGHETESVEDAHKALARLGSEEFDLIISDVRMPGMSGEELGEELRRRRPRFTDRLLLTTGDTLGTVPGDLGARTGHEVLRKPFDLDELRRVVRSRLASLED